MADHTSMSLTQVRISRTSPTSWDEHCELRTHANSARERSVSAFRDAAVVRAQTLPRNSQARKLRGWLGLLRGVVKWLGRLRGVVTPVVHFQRHLRQQPRMMRASRGHPARAGAVGGRCYGHTCGSTPYKVGCTSFWNLQRDVVFSSAITIPRGKRLCHVERT